MIIYTDDNGLEHDYPTAYGTACIAWDEILPPICGADGFPLEDQPNYCSQPWCYIDPEKCYKADM